MTEPQDDKAVIRHLEDQLDLANSRMSAANLAFQSKTNDALELHAQLLLIQKKNADLINAQTDQQKVINALQNRVVELTEENKRLVHPEDLAPDAT
jgi:hypothetical protein